MKILLFGKRGQVGREIEKCCKAEIGIDLRSYDSDQLNLTDSNAIRHAITSFRPDWVINAAAYTAVDKAESERDLAFRVNADAPEQMAIACEQVGSDLVHYSTDYVFDGRKPSPYTEADGVNPQSVYGESKLDGEVRVRQILPNALIFRTAWVYSAEGKNFVRTMLALAKNRDHLKVVNDQKGCPTFANDIAAATMGVIHRVNAEPESARGIFHLTGENATTWYGFCTEIMEISGQAHVSVEPITTEQFPTAAARPRNSVLNCSRIESEFGIRLADWRQSLRACLANVDV
ncbi:MAG: dTDP-4-dehydrorhamnose reductase [Pseudomonadota bacterium]